MLEKEAQTIFNILVPAFREVAHQHALFTIKDIVAELEFLESPLENYLSSLKTAWKQNNLKPEDFDEQFLTRLYKQSFHTGPIPKNRNHMVLSTSIDAVKRKTRESDAQEPVLHLLKPLKCWIDLDQIASEVNSHFQVNHVKSYKCTFASAILSNQCFHSHSGLYLLRLNVSNEVKCKPFSSFATHFLLGSSVILGAVGIGLFIASIAFNSIILLSLGGIAIIGATLSELLRSNSFYKHSQTITLNKLENKNALSTPIEQIFNQYLQKHDDKELRSCLGQKEALDLEPVRLDTNLLPSM